MDIGQYVYVGEAKELAKVIGFPEERPDLVQVQYLRTFRFDPKIERLYEKRIILPVTDLRELIQCAELDSLALQFDRNAAYDRI